MALKTVVELDVAGKTFASGLLPELIGAVRQVRPGELLALVARDTGIGPDLEAWCRFTRNALVETTVDGGQWRWVIRCGEAPPDPEAERPIGSRLWLYTNFDCNLACDYCCVRSSPKAPRRPLGLERIRRIAEEAEGLAVSEIFVTGGEPFLLPDIAGILQACAAAAPTTVLTNGMLLTGRRLEALRAQSPERLTLQISLDSPTPERHDRHRGTSSWERAWRGVQRARAEGFRVRLAASVSNDEEANEFRRFLDAEQIEERDRVIRPIVLRGFAEDGLALARMDLLPEVTITAEGVYWHPVGAEDSDLLITRDIFPLADAFAAVRRAFDEERRHGRQLAAIFNCA